MTVADDFELELEHDDEVGSRWADRLAEQAEDRDPGPAVPDAA